MKRYFVEEQMDGTYRVFFVNLVTRREEFFEDIFTSKRDAQAFCDELNADAEE